MSCLKLELKYNKRQGVEGESFGERDADSKWPLGIFLQNPSNIGAQRFLVVAKIARAESAIIPATLAWRLAPAANACLFVVGRALHTTPTRRA